jgi:hypothetical protein
MTDRTVHFKMNPYGEGAFIFISERNRYYLLYDKLAGFLKVGSLYTSRCIDEDEAVYLTNLIESSTLPDGEILIKATEEISQRQKENIWKRVENQIYKQIGFPFSLN